MPSYYDSTKKKPGKAKLKYAKGRSVKGAEANDEKGAQKKMGGGRVTRSIDGRATKGLTKGSRRR